MTLNSIRMLGIDEDKVNVNGGAVALGHPIGASGARILGALVLELRRRGGGLGCAAICSGGGQGDAVIVRVPTAAYADARRRRRASAAFFDLDRTLMAGSSAFAFVRARAQGGLAEPPASWSRDALANVAVPPARLDRRRRPTRCASAIGEMLEGVRVRDLSAWRPTCSPACCRASTRRCCRSPTSTRTPAGRSTSAPRPRRRWPRCSRHVLGFDGGIGTRAGGRRRRLHRPRRAARSPTARARRRRCASWPASEGIDLAASWAYSDSESDLPMLRAVGHPVAVNPDAELRARRRARRAGRCCASSARAAAEAGRGARRRSSPAARSCGTGAAPRPAAAALDAMSLHELTDEQREIRDARRRFADEEIAPHAAAWDREHRFPREVFEQLGELGLMGVCVPQEHGGAGADFLSYVLVLEELSRADAGVGVTVAVHTSAGTLPILAHGTREQVERLVPPLAQGHELAAFALTEPEAGSDAGAHAHRARADGPHHRHQAVDHQRLARPHASRLRARRRRAGITAFLVRRGADGLRGRRARRRSSA